MNQLTLTDHPYLYLGSLSEARRSDEAGLWRASHQCNVACKQAIEAAIRAGFNGMHLKDRRLGGLSAGGTGGKAQRQGGKPGAGH